MKTATVLASAALMFFAAGTASADVITYDQMLGGPGFYNGSGNPDGGFTISTSTAAQVGLRVKQRQDPNVIHTPTNVYNVPAGPQVGPPANNARGWWNYEWSIYLNGLTLDDVFPFSTMTVRDMTAGVSKTVNFPYWGDSAYFGPGGETQGNAGNNFGADLFDDHFGAQNSGNAVFGDFPLNTVPGYTYDMNAQHHYRFTIDLKTANGTINSNTINVLVGNAQQVPEPATLGLFGLAVAGVAARFRRRKTL